MAIKRIRVKAAFIVSVVVLVGAYGLVGIQAKSASENSEEANTKEGFPAALERFEEQLEIKMGIFGLKGQERAEKLIEIAAEKKEKGETELALELLERALALRTSDKINWTISRRMVEIYDGLEKPEKAIDVYSRYIKMSSPGIRQTLAYSYRADLYEKIGEIDKAEKDRKKLQELI